MEKEAGIVTIDHDEIRDWVEDRDGRPALAHESDSAGTRLRVVFGDAKETVLAVSWDEFFKRFESEHLAFVYDSDAMEGNSVAICEFVDRGAFLEEIENGGVEDENGEFDDGAENVDEEEL